MLEFGFCNAWLENLYNFNTVAIFPYHFVIVPCFQINNEDKKCLKISFLFVSWQPMRGAGGPLRGHAIGGLGIRGAAARGRGAGPVRGAPRGGRGAINGNSPAGSPVGARGGKRKAGTDLQSGTSKRRNTDVWGTQPIAQQPLKQDMKQDLYGAISYDGNESGTEWYQDSYGQQWK